MKCQECGLNLHEVVINDLGYCPRCGHVFDSSVQKVKLVQCRTCKGWQTEELMNSRKIKPIECIYCFESDQEKFRPVLATQKTWENLQEDKLGGVVK